MGVFAGGDGDDDDDDDDVDVETIPKYLATAIWYYGRCFEKGLGQQAQNVAEAKK